MYGSERCQLMQVYVQKLINTTLPRTLCGVSGGELSQALAPSNDGSMPSIGSGCMRIDLACGARSWACNTGPAAVVIASTRVAASDRERNRTPPRTARLLGALR